MKLNSVAALLKFYLFSLVNMEASKSVTLRTSMFEKKKSNIKEAEWSGNCPSDIPVCYLNERE